MIQPKHTEVTIFLYILFFCQYVHIRTLTQKP